MVRSSSATSLTACRAAQQSRVVGIAQNWGRPPDHPCGRLVDYDWKFFLFLPQPKIDSPIALAGLELLILLSPPPKGGHHEYIIPSLTLAFTYLCLLV